VAYLAVVVVVAIVVPFVDAPVVLCAAEIVDSYLMIQEL
jgi:hypothetical protein